MDDRGQRLPLSKLSLRRFDSLYCRVTVRDLAGGRAWSNPIWFDGV